MVNKWKNLPDDMVNTATIITFEKRLDKHWKNHDYKYDHTTRIMTTRPEPDMQSQEDNYVNMELESQA